MIDKLLAEFTTPTPVSEIVVNFWYGGKSHAYYFTMKQEALAYSVYRMIESTIESLPHRKDTILILSVARSGIFFMGK